MTTDAEGGVWTYTRELVQACLPLGVRFTLAILGRRPADSSVAHLKNAGVDVRSCPGRLEWMPGSAADVARSADWLEALASDLAPDVVHVNGFRHAACRFPCPAILVAHSCVCSWWRAVRGDAAPADWDGYRENVAAGLAAAARVVAPTIAMLRALCREHPAVRHGDVIWNGLAGDGHAVDVKEPLVFAAGRLWDEAKNLARLGAIAHTLSWPVVVAGSTMSPDGHASAVPGVRCLGHLDGAAVRAWMRRAAVYAWPALYEPFGLSVLEAAQAQCALVLSDIPSLRELWEGAARFVPSGDPEALAAALVELAGDPAACRDLGRRAAARAPRYSRERFGAAYRRLYGEVIDEAGSGTGSRSATALTLN